MSASLTASPTFILLAEELTSKVMRTNIIYLYSDCAACRSVNPCHLYMKPDPKNSLNIYFFRLVILLISQNYVCPKNIRVRVRPDPESQLCLQGVSTSIRYRNVLKCGCIVLLWTEFDGWSWTRALSTAPAVLLLLYNVVDF